jgi:hypothetical protein
MKKIMTALLAVLMTSQAFGMEKDKQALYERLDQIAAPYKSLLLDQLQKNAELKRSMDSYYLELSKITNLNAKSDAAITKQVKMVEALNLKYSGVHSKWFKAAQVDEKRYLKESENAIQAYGKKSGKRYKVQYRGFLNVSWRELFPVPPRQKPSPEEHLLLPPFEFREEENNGTDFDDVTVDLETGRISARSVQIFAGANTNRAGIGHFLRMNQQFSRANISAVMPETNSFIGAGAVLFGAAGGDTSASIKVIARGDTVCESSFELESLYAVVIGFFFKSSDTNIVFDCDFPAPRIDEDIAIQFTVNGGAWAGGAATSRARASSTPRDIRIRLE